MTKLSILIPARNEMFLNNTINDILKNSEEDTEILVGLDGAWAVEPIPQHPKVSVIYFPNSIGQRAITNKLCSISRAKYVMKLDAHCSFDKGFDRKLIEDMNDNWTVVPAMRNLHAFNWVCKKCGRKWYQGPTPEHCCADKKGKTQNDVCDSKEFYKEIVWHGKESPISTSYRMNPQLEFKYWGDYKKQQKGDIVDTLSLQGSCFMLTRDKYWELDICDDSWGSWGGQGAEVALKTWLSGGEVKCNKKTWYAHLFRTQGGDFGFPYPNPGNEQKKAKDTLRDTFLNDKWDKAKYKLQWLIDKFNPPEWDSKKAIIYYTDNKLNIRLSKLCRKQLLKANIPIISCSLKPIDFGKNIVYNGKRGYLTLFNQILTALKSTDADYVFFCEHDVLYHPSYFNFTPSRKDRFYYNNNVMKWNGKEGVKYDCRWLSQLCADRKLMVEHYSKRIELLNQGKKLRFEPGTKKGIDNHKTERWEAKETNIDIRHGNNLTGVTRFKLEDFRTKPKNFKNVDLAKWAIDSLEKIKW